MNKTKRGRKKIVLKIKQRQRKGEVKKMSSRKKIKLTEKDQSTEREWMKDRERERLLRSFLILGVKQKKRNNNDNGY